MSPSPHLLVLIIAAAIVGLLVVGVGGMVAYQILFPPVWTEQLSFKNSTGQYDSITKYRNATDVSYSNLSAFLASATPGLEDQIFANSNYTPVEYAVLLHDDAQRHQINCTLVPAGISSNTPKHVLVAFYTTDGGMVYVDLTAMNVSAQDYPGLDFSLVRLERDAWKVPVPSINASDLHPEATERRSAQVVSYAGLQSFLAGDRTENRTYEMPTYTCLDFAVDLHDRAEAAGIKNGIVSVSFEGKEAGHAFNAFPTTDKGIVYVDDTGANASVLAEGRASTDNVVYLQEGKELGEFPMSQVDGHLDYAFYLDRKARIQAYQEQWKQYAANLTAYNAEVDDFNSQSAANNRFYASYKADCDQYSAAVSEYNRQMDRHNQVGAPAPTNLAELQAWKARLEAQYDQYAADWDRLNGWNKNLESKLSRLKAWRNSLTDAEEYHWITYAPPGVVDDIEIYWG